MIKIDYEGAWKELRNEYGGDCHLDEGYKISLYSIILDLEQKHTQSSISSELEQLDCLLTNCDFTPSVAGALRLIYGILKKNKED